MATQLFANNASTALNGAIDDSTTTIVVADGSVFPTPTGGDWFVATLVGYGEDGLENAWEIVRVTARSGNTLTATRAQEGTTAVAWDDGTLIELRLTAESVGWIGNEVTQAAAEAGTGTARVAWTVQRVWQAIAAYISANVASIRAVLGFRETLTANRTYYVRADGSDSNNGLSNTSGGAFLTLQKAWDTISMLDLSIYSATIQVGSGTYTGALSCNKVPVGGSQINIIGDTTTPANVHLNVTGTCVTVSIPLQCPVVMEGFKFTFTGSSVSAVNMTSSGTFTVRNSEVAGGSTGFRGAFRAFDKGARLIVGAGMSFTGNMAGWLQAGYGTIELFAVTYTFTGSPAWNWVGVSSTFQGFVKCDGATFSGAATGVRYTATSAGGIYTNGAGATFLPGDVAGTATSPGWYA